MTIRAIIVSIFLIPYASISADSGQSGLAFLKIDVDGRAAAMGGAYTAISSGADAAYWNPAGLANASQKNLVLMHNVWLDDITQEFASWQFMSGKHNLALSANLMIYPGIEIRGERPTEDPDGVAEAINFYSALSYARDFSGWRVGLSVKYLFERYYLAQANGWAMDVGIQRAAILKNLDWGLAVANMGKMDVLQKVATPLPLILRSGLLYHLPFQFLEGGHLLSADVQYVKDEHLYLRAGSEWNIIQYLSLRGGLIWYKEGLRASAGFGLIYNSFRLDYAFVPFADDLGNSHRFSVGFLF